MHQSQECRNMLLSLPISNPDNATGLTVPLKPLSWPPVGTVSLLHDPGHAGSGCPAAPFWLSRTLAGAHVQELLAQGNLSTFCHCPDINDN